MMPSTPYDAKGLLESAIREDNPVIFIEHKLLYNTTGDVPEGEYTIPLGVADLKREGQDITILTYSQMVLLSMEAAEILKEEEIDCEVIDLCTLDPLDVEAIVKSIKKTHRAIIVEEDHKKVGVGAEISSLIMEECFDYLDAPVKCIAAMDVPIPFSKVLEDKVRPKVENIVKGVRDILGKDSDG